MSTRNPTDWMWAQACDLIEQAERMQRQFFRPAMSSHAQAVWEPPVDIFEDDREVVVVVALPGVPADRVIVTAESGDLVVRAEARLPLAGSRRTVRRLESPYGYFERRVRLPGVRLDGGTHEVVNGCLILRLRRAELAEGL